MAIRFAKYGLSAALLGAASVHVASLLGACDPDEHRRSTPSDASSTGSCSAAPGQFPAADCEPSDNSGCDPAGGQCPIDTTKCGDVSCLPMASNTGTTLDFRFRRLNLIAPPALTYSVNPTLQTAVINGAVDLNAHACGELGKGTFSWLLQIDTANKKVTTGGAPPVADPYATGYCFYDQTVSASDAGAPIHVGPVTVDLDPSSTATTFTTKPLPKLYVPIFLDAAGSSVIILPLSNPVLKDVTVSQNGNCVGAFNPAALPDKSCQDVFSDCSKWHTAGSLAGYITLKEADDVFIKELNQSLCVVLTQQAPKQYCKDSSGTIAAKGDYCSTSQKPGDCQDSFWLAATFAASAVKINDGASTPACQGRTTDAGADAGDAGGDAGSDTGTDAPSDAPTDGPADAGAG